ncbi:MAG: helix-turn-helix domain-containing protein [Actinomycetaceae bacterium]|nr:helix-turn-helix domain-containing protein [Actinomycetaceae bacterium]MDU0970428.1 helix-turn-helix domain-containing protein [Actinomycetaceae bacterium]
MSAQTPHQERPTTATSAAAPSRAPQATPPTGRRERAKAEKRARISAAISELLATRGYVGMTTADVSRLAKVSEGTVFQYAASKPEMLMMATAQRWRPYVEVDVDQIVRECPRPLDAIVAILDPIIEDSLASPDTTVFIAREILFGTDGVYRREVQAIVRDLERVIARVIAEDAEPSEMDELGAKLVVSATLVELNRTREKGVDPDVLHRQLRQLIAVILAGMADAPAL